MCIHSSSTSTGGAHGDRGDHWRRPGSVADPRRRRAEARRDRTNAGLNLDARVRHPGKRYLSLSLYI